LSNSELCRKIAKFHIGADDPRGRLRRCAFASVALYRFDNCQMIVDSPFCTLVLMQLAALVYKLARTCESYVV